MTLSPKHALLEGMFQSLLFLPLLSLPAFANTASEANAFAQTYSATLRFLVHLSFEKPAAPDGGVERDLALCEVIGETHGNVSELAGAVAKLGAEQPARRATLSTRMSAVITSRTRLLRFCVRRNEEGYRDVAWLQGRIDDAEQDLSRLQNLFAEGLLGQTVR